MQEGEVLFLRQKNMDKQIFVTNRQWGYLKQIGSGGFETCLRLGNYSVMTVGSFGGTNYNFTQSTSLNTIKIPLYNVHHYTLITKSFLTTLYATRKSNHNHVVYH